MCAIGYWNNTPTQGLKEILGAKIQSWMNRFTLQFSHIYMIMGQYILSPPINVLYTPREMFVISFLPHYIIEIVVWSSVSKNGTALLWNPTNHFLVSSPSLQIPPPKPPPPEMHFIPNPNNTEFIYLLGIEQCVEHILLNGKMQDPHPTPFVCTQCGTDFTPSWKWDKSSMKGKGEENGKELFPFFNRNKLMCKGVPSIFFFIFFSNTMKHAEQYLKSCMTYQPLYIKYLLSWWKRNLTLFF